MLTISLCMIVRDEEATLSRCLTPLCELVDEMIIVDTGSTDGTREIALSFNARLFDFTWIYDFSAARNFAFEQATKEYIMWLDADDVLEPEDCQRLSRLKQSADFPYDSVTMLYHLTFDDEGRPVHTMRRNRLVRRDRNFRWIGAVHEYLAVSGNIYHSDIAVKHSKNKPFTDRNLQIYLNRRHNGEAFPPRDQYYFANELFDHGRYEEAVKEYETFLEGGAGWSEDRISACHRLADCYTKLGRTDKQMLALLCTLLIDTPRAEFCCKMGSYFIERHQFENAVYWYRQATLLERPKDPMAIHDEFASTVLPHIQLCYCYDRLGERNKAKIHHEIAKWHAPNHPSVVYNERYFNGSL
ncbi:tetratricopeptide repeat-containing glycosyltransferase family 2 protein [Paenibacillus elgii]|uniref:tetratricopeptide repeat-containing glycosyltransferase family 2 protein n=1 Tax=Paenibacillus elgii TaxID=189691 RepID=UPI0013D43C0C|nr:glycosyltransferase family 2 protein [Paenibacillus elgii]